MRSPSFQINTGSPASTPGGTTISRPKEIFVTTDGNNGTAEIGNPAKPFETVAAALVAGELSAQAYTIVLGAGVFSITGLQFSLYRDGWIGQGFQTTLTINNNGVTTAGISLNEKIVNLRVDVTANGVNSPDDMTDPTPGGDVILEGFGWIIGISTLGGSAWNPSGQGYGMGGSIALNGDFICSGAFNGMSGSDGAGTAGASNGALIADGCDFRSAAITVGDITFGRCSYTTGLIITNDKGGNASW